MSRKVVIDTVVSSAMTKIGGALAFHQVMPGERAHDAYVAAGSVFLAVGIVKGYHAFKPVARYVWRRVRDEKTMY